MKTGMTLKATSSFLSLICLAAITAMTFGCQARMDAKVRSNLGFNSEPPRVNSILAYQTNDPETKIYMAYFEALENDLHGIRGKSMGEKAYEEQIKKMEEPLRKEFNKISTMSADEKYATIEKILEDQRRMGPPIYLTLIPAQADPKESSARITKSAVTGNEDIEAKITAITINYKFNSVQEMSMKAHELANKLKPVLATQQGWTFQDSALLKKQMTDNALALEQNKDINPELKNKTLDLSRGNMKVLDAGQTSMKYIWSSNYRSQMGTISVQASNLMMVDIIPTLEPVNGNYWMSVSLARNINQLRDK